ncbi:hypothetical protein [Kribbella deserti]|uniref:Uncharacterized protein n=1 Tax=Kribbella deserti TaxID=1926257 RepID=A0ABV6QEI4_9ACTN
MVQVDTGNADWQPPWWLRVFGPLIWLLLSALAYERRGWIIAIVVAVLLAPLGAPVSALLRWSKQNPQLAGIYCGPLAFAVPIVTTPLPIWVCAAVGLGGALIALWLGATRGFAHG